LALYFFDILEIIKGCADEAGESKVVNDRNIPYQFKKRNKTEQISSHFKSRSVPDFSAKFRPKCSGSIPHVPFRS
jgi:3-isopropylmalate dehydratase small subunit